MQVDFIASNTKLNTPDKLFERPTYPSGIVEGKKTIYQYSYPSNQYPILLLPQPLFDEGGDSIKDGYYIVALSDDNKYLLLIQSNELKAKIPVLKYEELKPNQEEIEEEAAIKARLQKAQEKRKLKKYRAAEDDLKNFKTRLYSKMSVDIYDSGQGYYLVKYWRREKKALGVIAK